MMAAAELSRRGRSPTGLTEQRRDDQRKIFFFFLFFPDDGGSRGGQKPADGREGPSGRRRGVFFNLTSPHGSGQDYQGCSMGSGGG